MLGTMYSQGDLVLVPFPFTDLSAIKQRPAIVVSPSWFNGSRQDVVLAAVTSQPHALRDPRIDVALTKQDLASGSLVAPSVVSTAKLFTCEQKFIIKQVGTLAAAKRDQVLAALCFLFEPSPSSAGSPTIP